MSNLMSNLIFSACYLATVAVQISWLIRLSAETRQLRADLDWVRRQL
jgi:hypothetical protein